MATIANTKENNAIVNALLSIEESGWLGSTTHDNINACLTALNLQTSNSGWYKPVAVQINNLRGLYMINQDGSIFYDARIIKENNSFKIEYLTLPAFAQFEQLYIQKLSPAL